MKKRKRLLCVGVAAAMFVSAGAAAFAAALDDTTYRAEYTEYNTRENVAATIAQVDAFAAESILTGDSLEEIYKGLPSLSGVVSEGGFMGFGGVTTGDAEWYKQYLDGELFANLPDAEVTADSLTAYFEEYPVILENEDEFVEKLDNVIDAVLCDKLHSTIKGAGFLVSSNAEGLATSLDTFCRALGIEQSDPFGAAFGWGTSDKGITVAETYIKNIVHALLPDMGSSLMTILRTASVGQNAVDLYAGVKGILENLAGIMQKADELSSIFGADLSAAVEQINAARDTFNSLPTKETEFGTAIDLEAAISAVPSRLTDILALAGIELPPDVVNEISISFDEKPADAKEYHLTLESFNEANIEAAEGNEDFFMVLVNYFYRNFIEDEENVQTIEKVLDRFQAEIPAETAQLLRAMMNVSSFDELVWMMRDQLSIATGNGTIGEYPVPETTTESTTEETTVETTTEETTTEETTVETTTEETTTEETTVETTTETTTETPTETTSEATTAEETTQEESSEETTAGEVTTAEDTTDSAADETSTEETTEDTPSAVVPGVTTTAPSGTGNSGNAGAPETGDAVLGAVAFSGVAAAAALLLLRKQK